MKSFVRYTEWLRGELANPERAVGYLNDLLKSPRTPDYLSLVNSGLRELVRSCGVTNVSKATGLGRNSLYKAFSSQGNSHFQTVLRVLDAAGLELQVRRASSKQKASNEKS